MHDAAAPETASESVFPPEIFHAILTQLKAAGLDRTIARFAQSSKTLLDLATPVLFSSLAPLKNIIIPTQTQTTATVFLLIGANRRNTWRFVEHLDLRSPSRYYDRSPLFKAVVDRFLKASVNLYHLTIRITPSNVKILWPLVARLESLVGLHLVIANAVAAERDTLEAAGSFPPNLQMVTIDVIDWTGTSNKSLDVVTMNALWATLAACPFLTRWTLRGIPDWTLSRYDDLVGKLKEVEIRGGPRDKDEEALEHLFLNLAFEPERLVLTGRDLGSIDVLKALSDVEGIQVLQLEHVTTLSLLVGLPKTNLLILVKPIPNFLMKKKIPEGLQAYLPHKDSTEARFTVLEEVLMASTQELEMIDYPEIEAGVGGTYTAAEAKFWTEIVPGMRMPVRSKKKELRSFESRRELAKRYPINWYEKIE